MNLTIFIIMSCFGLSEMVFAQTTQPTLKKTRAEKTAAHKPAAMAESPATKKLNNKPAVRNTEDEDEAESGEDDVSDPNFEENGFDE